MALRRISLAEVRQKMGLQARKLNLKVRIEKARQDLAATNAQLKSIRQPRKKG